MILKIKHLAFIGLWAVLITHSFISDGQTIYKYQSDSAYICFTNMDQAQYVPHIIRKYNLSRDLHRNIWDGLPSQIPFMLLTDMADDGNAGVSAVPHTRINIGIAPLNKTFFTSASSERFDFLFKHEYTHVVMHDKANGKDNFWRNFTGNKVVPDSKYPLSAVWSYLDAPRVFSPRWYHEGIACFMETWLSGGAGRALGGYDEAYFRTKIKDGQDLYSVVGLETEGSTSDVEQGATGYLYGTRFVNYLVYKYGYEMLFEFYNRTEDSETSYVKQFEKVYGKGLREAWAEWQEYESVHQKENLKAIAEFPLTELHKLVDKNLGSVSPMIVDEDNHVAYAAVNHTGDFPQIVSISLSDDGMNAAKIKRLAYIDGSKLYHPAYLAYDKKGQRLIWSDRNGKVRGLVVYDINRQKIIKRMKYQRMYDLCYDNVNDCLYGLLTNQGLCYLVKYDSSLKNRSVIFTFPFGVSVSDLDVSHDGKHIIAAVQGKSGEHSLIMFDMDNIEEAAMGYRTLYSIDDSNLSQFRFSADDNKLVGFSYYTGVPNVWSYDLASGNFDLLTNVQTGVFGPYLASDDKVYALEYSSDGMTPVVFDYKELHDANSVEYLGQKAFNANPDLAKLADMRSEEAEIAFSEVYDSITVYNPFKEVKFQGFYPDISGFTDKSSWNHMTPVIGAHLSFYDPLSLFSVNLFAGASPWSGNEWKNRFHANADVKYRRWTLNAAWNPTNFYDLFGPRRASRKGYQVSLSYDYANSMQAPYSWNWGGSLAHYGGLDALPLYQEIEVDEGITSFQTAAAYIKGGKVRGTIGAIEAEQGYRFYASGYTYFADSRLFPSIDISGDLGFLLPVGQHNSFWLKGAAGQAFGDSSSALGNSYFGGFRNNYVDNGDINRYRTASAFPGARIDQIAAHTYAKLTGEVDFSPIRFNNFGALQCYPNYIQLCLFGHDLMTDWWGSEKLNKANYISAGAQMNIQMVFFTHMKTTLSLGYARAWGNGLNQGEFMVSLKLL